MTKLRKSFRHERIGLPNERSFYFRTKVVNDFVIITMQFDVYTMCQNVSFDVCAIFVQYVPKINSGKQAGHWLIS